MNMQESVQPLDTDLAVDCYCLHPCYVGSSLFTLAMLQSAQNIDNFAVDCGCSLSKFPACCVSQEFLRRCNSSGGNTPVGEQPSCASVQELPAESRYPPPHSGWHVAAYGHHTAYTHILMFKHL